MTDRKEKLARDLVYNRRIGLRDNTFNEELFEQTVKEYIRDHTEEELLEMNYECDRTGYYQR